MAQAWPVAEQGELLQAGRTDVEKTPRDELQAVWSEIGPELARLASALGIEPSRVEDVLQDVYLTAWEKPPPEADRADLRRWLFRVAVNRCHLEHRRVARWKRVLQGLASLWGGQSQPASAPADDYEDKELVRQALARLAPLQRSVLVLRYFAEFDSKEIGGVLNLPDSTVRSHLRAARQRLAAELKKGGYRNEP